MYDYVYDMMLVLNKYWNRIRKGYQAEDDLRLPYSSGIGSCHDCYMFRLRCV
jgi:hypothetical protein